ncbi:AAA family ATPase [Actinomadura macrotermitis]|uniref:AAA+ ATPase domain-containing protein n=1 Tax=Actinomadura macrotermitis TaxID=2585200 RepID=A0A7K0BS20_9ACTN|nr:AAA family ATPase [Actinomadura macrotermitis]MQY03993.1 hypothetical protein [Actinomadura macrotermitis]
MGVVLEETIADRLRAARRRRFAGRTEELELFRTAVTSAEPPFTVLFVHGPGGVGKSALLDAFAAVAEEAGAAVTVLDGRTVAPAPHVVRAVVPAPRPAGGGARRVLLLDTYERLMPIDDWIRDAFVPDLPAGTVVVLAGREAPGPGWTADPGWRELLRVLPLRNLAPDDGAAYLRAEGVPAALHQRVLAATHGHPLALALLTDVLAQRPGAAPARIDLTDTPDVVRRLLDRFLEEVPTEWHRRALEVCAHAMITTQDLLRDALGDLPEGAPDAATLFGWMRRLSFVSACPGGLYPHDVARDVLDADLRWRDRSCYLRVHRRIRRHLLDRVFGPGGPAQRQAITELTFLQRVNPVVRSYLAWTCLGTHRPGALRPGDHAAIRAMTERHEGPASAAIAAYWLDRAPAGFVVVRGPADEPLGFGLQLRLDTLTAADRAADPGAAALWEHVHRDGPPAPGDAVIASRFAMDAEHYQRPSATFNVLLVAFMQRRIAEPRLAGDLLAAYPDDGDLAGFFRYGGYHRAEDADFTVGGRRNHVFAYDHRGGGIGAWLERLAERELGYEPAQPPPMPVPARTLSRAEFTAAVRRALRDLHDPGALARSPLAGSRLAAGGDLAGTLRAAADALRADPRGERRHRAVDRTYLRPAPTQERAAELLGLPFSTYRRHLTEGVRRIADTLWRWELDGRP